MKGVEMVLWLETRVSLILDLWRHVSLCSCSISLSPWRSRVLSFLALPYSEEERQVSAGKEI